MAKRLESKFWAKVKIETPEIKWTRIENTASFGLQALAPRLTKLYEGSSIHDLLALGTDAPNAIACDWDAIRACFNKI
jgi:hypothetical protein